MMSFEIFLLLLMIVSVLTGLVTEGIKKLLDEAKKPYRAMDVVLKMENCIG